MITLKKFPKVGNSDLVQSESEKAEYKRILGEVEKVFKDPLKRQLLLLHVSGLRKKVKI